MKLTNRLNLPSSIYNAVAHDPYSRGDAHISVTGLIGPARKRMLEITHGDSVLTPMGKLKNGFTLFVTVGAFRVNLTACWSKKGFYKITN
jgi:hypothetical protein